MDCRKIQRIVQLCAFSCFQKWMLPCVSYICLHVLRMCLRSTCVWVHFLMCDYACVSQQLRIDLFLSGLNGNTELSESAFPLWGPSVATAWKTTHTYMVVKRCLHAHTHTNASRGQRHNSTDTFAHLSDSCPVLQDVQVRQHVNNIWTWAGLRTMPAGMD